MRAKRSLGQNFLVDPNIQRRIVDALEPQPGDEVVEIGPGTGALTRHLAGKVRRIVAVELDDRLAEELLREFDAAPGFELVHADALEVELGQLAGRVADLKVLGNIPYNITTPLLFHLLDRRHRPGLIVVMVQKEVAERILAPPGDRDYGALSVGVRAVADVERLFHVGRRAFRPVPHVDSTVLRIRPHRPPRLGEDEEADLRALTRAAFGWRRKQLQKILRSAPGYELGAPEIAAVSAATGLDLDRRPETLSPDGFVALARALRAVGRPRGGNPHAADVAPDAGESGGLLVAAGHELRTTISTIVGYQELLADGVLGPIEQSVAEGIARIGTAGQQLLSLLGGMLELAELDRRLLHPESAPVDIAAVIHAAAEHARSAAAEHGASIDTPDLAPGRTASTDAERLERVLELLLFAAIRTAPGQALELRVRTRADAPPAIELSGIGPALAAAARARQDRLLDADPNDAAAPGSVAARVLIARGIARHLGHSLEVASVRGRPVLRLLLSAADAAAPPRG